MFDPGWGQVEEFGTALEARLDESPDSPDGESESFNPTGR